VTTQVPYDYSDYEYYDHPFATSPQYRTDGTGPDGTPESTNASRAEGRADDAPGSRVLAGAAGAAVGGKISEGSGAPKLHQPHEASAREPAPAARVQAR
jgi:hypothetical protein